MRDESQRAEVLGGKPLPAVFVGETPFRDGNVSHAPEVRRLTSVNCLFAAGHASEYLAVSQTLMSEAQVVHNDFCAQTLSAECVQRGKRPSRNAVRVEGQRNRLLLARGSRKRSEEH